MSYNIYIFNGIVNISRICVYSQILLVAATIQTRAHGKFYRKLLRFEKALKKRNRKNFIFWRKSKREENERKNNLQFLWWKFNEWKSTSVIYFLVIFHMPRFTTKCHTTDKYDFYWWIFYFLSLITIYPIKIQSLYYFDEIQSIVCENTHQKQLNNYFCWRYNEQTHYFGWMSKNKEIDYNTCVLCVLCVCVVHIWFRLVYCNDSYCFPLYGQWMC